MGSVVMKKIIIVVKSDIKIMIIRQKLIVTTTKYLNYMMNKIIVSNNIQRVLRGIIYKGYSIAECFTMAIL